MIAARPAEGVPEVPAGSFVLAGGIARYLLVMGPKTHRLIKAIHASTTCDLAAMSVLFAAHGSELLAS